MKKLVLFLLCFSLFGCELMGMHRCDALSGWCVSSEWTPDAYKGWYTKEEVVVIRKMGTLAAMGNRSEIIKENKKKILEHCNIDYITEEILNGWSKDKAYNCAYKKGLCRVPVGKYKYECDFGEKDKE